MGIQSEIRDGTVDLVFGLPGISEALANMAAWIHDIWPGGMIDLKPRSTSFGAVQLSERDQCILQISEDLVRAAPLIMGIFPPGFSRLGLEFVSGSLSIYPHRLYEFESCGVIQDPFLEKIRAVIISLIDRQFPIWSFMILESYFPPIVQDIIRYIPHLYHLRSAPWYGHGGYHPRFADDLDRYPDDPSKLRYILSTRIQMIMDNQDHYIYTESIGSERKINIRNLWLNPLDPLEPIPRRPDLQIDFDMRNLEEYLKSMRMTYDRSDHPSIKLMLKIINQFWDPLTGAFAAHASGIAAPLVGDRL